ncbi:MAG: hypothetical protein JWO73_240 [Candidatus Taylorbacteria bacterium]|nr:hypothetical protein [Candidatus Taylorbacteria bacterium]
MQLFRKKFHQKTLKERVQQSLKTFGKCLLFLSFPLPVSAAAGIFWYYAMFKRGICFNERMEVILTAAWIPIFGILYGLLAAVIFGTVWNEYKAMRTSVKEYNIDTFLTLRDEEMSPLVHTMMLVFSAAILVSFMSLKYADCRSGMIVITSTAYLLSLIFIVIKEIDDPCGGLWYIKHIPEDWLKIDVKRWRKDHHDECRKKYEVRITKILEVTETAVAPKK